MAAILCCPGLRHAFHRSTDIGMLGALNRRLTNDRLVSQNGPMESVTLAWQVVTELVSRHVVVGCYQLFSDL